MNKNIDGESNEFPRMLVKLNKKENKIINELAQASFATYCIHQVPIFYPVLWSKIYQSNAWSSSEYYSLYLVLLSMSCYVACVFIDRIRKHFAEPLWLNCRLFKSFCNYLNSAYNFPSA